MENQIYFGIDLDDENAVISFFQLNMKEPETVSTVAGGEVFLIPAVLTKKKGIGQWYIGEEAKRVALQQGEEGAGKLLSRALNHEMVFLDEEKYRAEELLALYLKKLMLLAGGLGNPAAPKRLVIVLEQLSRELTELFGAIAPRLGLLPEQITLIDRKESFYYFVCSQQAELRLHDVCLFDYRGENITCYRLERNLRTTPQLVTITEALQNIKESSRDEHFLQVLKDSFQGHIVSSVYLVGEGFEGDWMKQSVAFLCKGRRAFIGKNLYSKGACHAAAVREKQVEWPFVYMGSNEMKVNVCLKLYDKGELQFYTLINAGDSWYEAVGECEVLLDGTPEIDFWLQLPNSREAKIEKLELADLPDRPPKTTRLSIFVRPLSDSEVQIKITDLGFGELFESSGKVWEYVMSL